MALWWDKKPGRKADPNQPSEKEIAQLERELARSQEALCKAHLILDVQGEIAGLLGLNFDQGHPAQCLSRCP